MSEKRMQVTKRIDAKHTQFFKVTLMITLLIATSARQKSENFL